MGLVTSKCQLCGSSVTDLLFGIPQINKASSPPPRSTAAMTNPFSLPLYSVYKQTKKIGFDDFEILKLVGKGGFGRVFLVRQKGTFNLFAMKLILKSALKRSWLRDAVMTERDIMLKADHPYLMKLRYAFQNKHYLAYIMDFMPSGTLADVLASSCGHQLDLATAKLCAAQIVLALEHMHEKLNVIYRDLKPANVFIDESGNVRLGDFGLSYSSLKVGSEQRQSLCGTPEYLAPEVLSKSPYDKTIDFWGLGCTLFEMLVGRSPFDSPDSNFGKLYARILQGKYFIPPSVDEKAVDLLRRLLEANPAKRIGAGGIAQIKSHSFFDGINWADLRMKAVKGPFEIKDTTELLQLRPLKLNRLGITDEEDNDAPLVGFSYREDDHPSDTDPRIFNSN